MSNQPATVSRSESFDMDGPHGRVRIKIALPHTPTANLSLMVADKLAAPVYVMDGNEVFGIVSDLARMMQFGGHVPPCLVIGIGYPEEDLDTFSTRRQLDLTPTDWASPWSDDHLPGGGAPETLSFLTETLLPKIAGKYEVDAGNGVLAGLSYGGLFSLYARAMQPGAFPHHIALSPSLFWDNRFVLDQLESSFRNGPPSPGRIFAAAGAREVCISPPSEPDMARSISMVQNVCTLGNLIALHRDRVTGQIKVFDDESHHSIIGIGFSKGLRYTIGDAAS